MGLEKLYFGIGILFMIMTIIYFTGEYFFSFSKILKSILLIIMFVTFFFAGEYFKTKTEVKKNA